jgi:hypothetical protein
VAGARGTAHEANDHLLRYAQFLELQCNQIPSYHLMKAGTMQVRPMKKRLDFDFGTSTTGTCGGIS